MPHQTRVSSTARRLVSLQVEPLEHRTLLNGSSVAELAKTSTGIQVVTIQVPSTYVSQQADGLDVTLVRTTRSGRGQVQGPLTVDFTAAIGALPGSSLPAPDTPGQQFTPVNESVSFAAGQATTNVVVPINSAAPNPGLVPIALSVGAPSRLVRGSDTTVYLASSPDAVPPSITGVHVVRRGIVLAFSKPMAPASVENIRNYAVKYSPSQQFSLADLEGVGLIQTLANTSQKITLRRAIYNPATDTVTLIPKVSWPSTGGLEISSPSTLNSRRANPHKAQPLTDAQGNALSFNGIAGGAFSISISKGHPYVAAQPILSDGS